MQVKKILPMIAAGSAVVALASAPASAQDAASFNNIIDQVLTADNVGNVISTAVNIAAIDGSVTINAGLVDSNVIGVDIPVAPGQIVQTKTVDAGMGGPEITEDLNRTYEAVNQSFGAVSTVAAGAINDTSVDFTEVGSSASAYGSAITDFYNVGVLEASNVTGGEIGIVAESWNAAEVNGSVVANVASANVSFASIDTVAAGAINTADIQAEIVGGNEAIANIDFPTLPVAAP
jgi:hypothetical protein